MKLPNLSYLGRLGQVRAIQARYEVASHRNPDTLVEKLLPASQRLACMLRGRLAISQLRRQPFYYYLLARTRHYDRVFAGAIGDGTRAIVNIGCGSDTRAYRYAEALRKAGIAVAECDQPQAIEVKRALVQRLGPAHEHVSHLPIDLNDRRWLDLRAWWLPRRNERALIMLEGVSPYVQEQAFREFLAFVAKELPPGSRLAYDFKAGDGAGCFRLPMDRAALQQFHAELGLHLELFTPSLDLIRQSLPDLTIAPAGMFAEDGLLELTVAPR